MVVGSSEWEALSSMARGTVGWFQQREGLRLYLPGRRTLLAYRGGEIWRAILSSSRLSF